MSNANQVKLIVTVRPEGITWAMRDDERKLGYGSCATLREVHQVEILAGLACVEISGVLSEADLVSVQQYGWRFVETKDAA